MAGLGEYLNRGVSEHETPHGLTVKLRPVQLESLAFSGKIPLTMMTEVASLTGGANGEVAIQDVQKHAGSFVTMVDAVAAAALVEPRITGVLSAENNTLDSVETLDFEDRYFIFQLATGATRELTPFRTQPPAISPT